MAFQWFRPDWSDPSQKERVEIVFDGRKKQYGAYELRKNYEERLVRSLFICILLTAFSIALPYVFEKLGNRLNKSALNSEEITLAEPPPIDKFTPPPPPLIIPPPVQQTIKFTPPKVVKDEEVADPPPVQEEMEKAQVSTITQEGSSETALPPENPVVAEPEAEKIFTIVEEMPSFPGGEKKMIEFILGNIHYPPVALENNITGKVYIKFMVDQEGKIRNPELLKGIGGGCNEEAMRILKLMPDWIPGRQNGNKVKVGGIVLHIDFTLR